MRQAPWPSRLTKGGTPYEQTAFQFSHHIVECDGTVWHAGQWINTEQGIFPNFEFVRELKKQLETDGGSVFRYAAHENTILNAVYEQLEHSNEPDKDQLRAWVKTVTKSKAGSPEAWEGQRNMIDLREWVFRYYFNPLTNGSNSIKDVLPAMLRSSVFLQEKYARPVYGTEIQSLNFTGYQWVTFDEMGQLVNPYHTLPSIHEGWDNEHLDELFTD